MAAHPRRSLATCCAAHTLHDGLADVTYVLLPLLAQTFGLTLAQVGMIRAAHRSAMAAFQIPAGLAAERHGERRLLALGTLVAGGAFVLLGTTDGFWAVLVAMFLAGAGSAVQHPLASTIVSRAFPGPGRRAALGTYNFSGEVGKFAFGGIVSLLLIAGVSWQAPVIGFGLAAFAVAAAVLLLIGDAPRERASDRIESAPTARAGWGVRDPRRFGALCAISALDAITVSGLLTFVAFLLIAKGVPTGYAALSVPLVLVGGMAGKLACGFLAERLGIVRMIVATEVATCAGIVALVALPPLAAFVLLPFLGVVLQGTSSVLYATVGEYVDEARLARSFGLFYTIGSVCGIAAPLAYGALGDRIGIEPTVAAVGIVVLLTVPLALLLRDTAPSSGTPTYQSTSS